jgi:CRP/FNR family cyclic AMP-dependent transcriptional regulator
MTGLEPLAVHSDWDSATDGEWVDVLTGLSLFQGVGKRELRRIVRRAEFAEFSAGETVVPISGRPDSFYVILGGTARAAAKPAARTLSAGDYFGEMSLLDGDVRSASVVATSDLHVMSLRRGAFEDALARSPSMARRLLTELAARVRTLERQAARGTT